MGPDMGAEGKHMAMLAEEIHCILTCFEQKKESSLKTSCAFFYFFFAQLQRPPSLQYLILNNITANSVSMTRTILEIERYAILSSMYRREQARCPLAPSDQLQGKQQIISGWKTEDISPLSLTEGTVMGGNIV